MPYRPLLARLPWACLLAGLAICACAGGCVHRRLLVRSDPPGALVYVDDHEIGTTPINADFIYYGRRKIRLVKDGYETLTVVQPISPPWWEIPPLDFVSENMVPGDIRDQRVLDFQLRPQTVVPTEQLLDRAEGLRRGSQASAAGVTPMTPGVRVNPPPPRVPEFMPTPPGQPVGPPAASPTPIGGVPVYPIAPDGSR